MSPPVRRPRSGRCPGRRWGAVACLVALVVPLVACSEGGGSDESPEVVLAAAKVSLDETSGVTLSLSATELPDGVDGVRIATGVATHAPAFDGNLTLVVNGLDVDVPVVAVDGSVFAQLPFTTSFVEVNPADYGAPDPAQLMNPDAGLSTWLVEAADIAEGDRVRNGEIVLNSYDGVLSGEVVDASIPSADEQSEFSVTFLIDDEGRLRTVQITGPFYDSETAVNYTVSIEDYGTTKNIAKP